jgi:hypothetical protein
LLGDVAVILEVGWGSPLPIEQLWAGTKVSLGEVISYVVEGERKGIFALGKADIALKAVIGDTVIVFSHDGYIHLKTHEVELSSILQDRWTNGGIRVFEREAGGDWREVGSGEKD